MKPFLYHGFEQAFETEEVYTASFPAQWWRIIEEEKKDFILPFKSKLLAKRLFSIFPEIIMIQSAGNKLSQGFPWIISKEPINDKAILVVVLTCIKYSNLKNRDQLELTAKLNWSKNSLRDLQEPDYFQLYPALIAHQFSAVPRRIMGIKALENRNIKFSPVSSGQGFEAVSEPISLGNESDKFSYVIKFELITRGLENRTLIKITPGSRRYYQRPGKNPIFDVKKGFKSSIYISHNHLLSVSNSNLKSFGKFYFYKKGNQLVWEDSSGDIIKELYPDFLSLEELLQNASELMNNNEVLIGYSDKAFTNGTRVKPGISVQERNGLIRAIRETFPDLIQVDDHFEIRLPRRVKGKRTYKFLNLNQTNELAFHFYGSNHLFEEALLKWQDEGYVQDDNGKTILNSEPKMQINFFNHGNEMIHELPIVEGEKSKAIKEYKNEMQKHLPKVEKNVSATAFIEIEPYHEMENSQKDSKATLRAFLAEKGITSQFIHPIEDSSDYKSRINNAFLDLLTDSALSHIDFEEPMFKDHTILSLSLVKKNWKQFLPVFSKIKDGKILFRPFGNSQWVDIQKYLTNNYSSASFIDQNKSSQLKRWMESTIIEELGHVDDDKNLYFVIDATLRRYWIKEISNQKLETIKNPFQEWNIFNIDRLKVIRINLTKDVPNYLIVNNNDDGNNHATGLYKNENGIYYSVGEKTLGLKVNKAASRIESQYHKPFGKQVAVEIIPVNYSNKAEQDLMAIIIHRLRHMALNFGPALRYPVMMHLADGVKKYFNNDFEYEDYAEDFDDALIDDDTEEDQLRFKL